MIDENILFYSKDKTVHPYKLSFVMKLSYISLRIKSVCRSMPMCKPFIPTDKLKIFIVNQRYLALGEWNFDHFTRSRIQSKTSCVFHTLRVPATR